MQYQKPHPACQWLCMFSAVSHHLPPPISSLTACLPDGTGAMIFCPLSELPSLGRNIPYIASFAIFVLCSLAVALVNTWPLFLAARFFQGFMGSPALATGGASMQDMVSHTRLQVVLSKVANSLIVRFTQCSICFRYLDRRSHLRPCSRSNDFCLQCS